LNFFDWTKDIFIRIVPALFFRLTIYFYSFKMNNTESIHIISAYKSTLLKFLKFTLHILLAVLIFFIALFRKCSKNKNK